MKNKYVHLSLLLFFIAAFSGLILSLANDITLPKIEAAQAAKINSSVSVLFADAGSNLEITKAADPNGTYKAVLYIREIYSGAENTGDVLGYVFIIKAPGSFNKSLQVMVGVKPDGTVAGVEYLNMTETPGVGSRVTMDRYQWFNEQFIGKTEITRNSKGSATNVDVLAGASYTSKSVINSVDLALKYFAENLKK